jgi:hypothetical protein
MQYKSTLASHQLFLCQDGEGNQWTENYGTDGVVIQPIHYPMFLPRVGESAAWKTGTSGRIIPFVGTVELKSAYTPDDPRLF